MKSHFQKLGRVCLWLILCLLFACATVNEPFITLEQFRAPDFEEDVVRGRLDPGAPEIIVMDPQPGDTVSTPFRVEVEFKPKGGAAIDLASLEIRYKIFDLTEKVIERMTVTETGISGEIGDIGPGKYKLRLSISDDQNRRNRAELQFVVTPRS